MNLLYVIKRVKPSFKEIRKEADILRLSSPWHSPEKHSRVYAKKIRNKYTSMGVVTSLPGIIPGLGTAAQVAVEAGSVSTDVIFMLRWMANVCYAVAYIHGRDIEESFDLEFTIVLGLWSGVISEEEIKLVKQAELTVVHFDNHMSQRIKNRMNQKIGRKLIAKYGPKYAGTAMGKLIPFGIGATIGGAFNYTTMQRFNTVVYNYFTGTALSVSQV